VKHGLTPPGVGRPVVTIVYRSLPHYRIAFYESLKAELDWRGVSLRLIYGQPDAEEAKKQDTGVISWGHVIQNRLIPVGARSLVWQPCTAMVRGSDLVIVEQASRLLLNYLLLARQSLGGSRVAFWGHGRNFQEHTASRVGESVKRLVSRWPHWWFAYTETSADVVRRLPYPPDRITVVQNAMDTASLRQQRASIGEETLVPLRLRWGIQSQNVAIYAGGLYAEKRVGFLLDAARALRRRIADFELIVIGAGPKQVLVEEAAREHRWIHYPGPRFGAEKVPYFSLSRVMLLPGLVGLAVLDSFALEVPLVTVDLPYHSPEIDYLRDGENGLKLPAGTDPEGYAAAVAGLLSDVEGQKRLQAGCRSIHSRRWSAASRTACSRRSLSGGLMIAIVCLLRPDRSEPR
jgi:glycosyltransferase involved in cell wall biosynthesis